MKRRSLYDELGVNPKAGRETIKKAYRRRARETHPDRAGSTEKFLAVQRAYEILSHADKRKHYDETGDSESRPPAEEKARDVLIQLFVRNAEDIPGADLLSIVKKEIGSQIQKMQEGLVETRKKAEGFRSVAKRLKRKNGKENVISASLFQLADSAQSYTLAISFDIEVHKAALLMADEFEFEVDSNAGPSQRKQNPLFSVFGGMS